MRETRRYFGLFGICFSLELGVHVLSFTFASFAFASFAFASFAHPQWMHSVDAMGEDTTVLKKKKRREWHERERLNADAKNTMQTRIFAYFKVYSLSNQKTNSSPHSIHPFSHVHRRETQQYFRDARRALAKWLCVRCAKMHKCKHFRVSPALLFSIM